MSESLIVKTKRDGTIKFLDNSGANTYTVAYEAGDLNISIPGPTVISPLDRGSLGSPPSLRYSDDAPITGSFTAYLRDLGDAAYLQWTIEGTDHGDASDHVLTLPFCVVTGSLSEGDPDQISISFTSYSVYPSAVT